MLNSFHYSLTKCKIKGAFIILYLVSAMHCTCDMHLKYKQKAKNKQTILNYFSKLDNAHDTNQQQQQQQHAIDI